MVYFPLFFSLDFHTYWSLDFKGAQNLQVNFSETWEHSTHWPFICMEVLQASVHLPWHMISRCLALASSSLALPEVQMLAWREPCCRQPPSARPFLSLVQSSSFLTHDKCFRRYWSISSLRPSVSCLFFFHICVILLSQQRQFLSQADAC